MQKTSQIVLILGGLGFIGSHIVTKILEDDKVIPIIIDNLSNSKLTVINKLQKLTNKDIIFYNCDLCLYDKFVETIKSINSLKIGKITSVIHLAGLKAVSESIKLPIEYYHNNLVSTINVIKVMKRHDIYNLIFSSSATVYGSTVYERGIRETDPFGDITNPYGLTKYMLELILKDLKKSDIENKWKIISLRYFNPVANHPSGLLHEDPLGIPNNLMPIILNAVKNKNGINVFGNDYDTPDGTCVRDFIHVLDLAEAHMCALNSFDTDIDATFNNYKVYNIGTGKGTSVLEFIKTFERVNEVKIDYKIVDRREGDIPSSFCDPSLAEKELGWKSKRTLEDICKDSYKSL